MGRTKTMIIGTAVLALSVLTCTQTVAGDFMRKASYASAGIYETAENSAEKTKDTSQPESSSDQNDSVSSPPESDISESQESADPESSSAVFQTNGTSFGEIIDLDRENIPDEEDYSAYTAHSGSVYRYSYEKFSSTDYINLKSGAQVRNCTEIPNSVLEEASDKLPEFHGNSEENSPRVLIYHTHATESFLPKSDWYDENYPIRSTDNSKNMIAVGDALCNALSSRGISVVHECKLHDYPMYTGAYYRSADSMLQALEKYPDLDIIIDLHRDGIVNGDGSLAAPVCEVNGKTAAQFMIISCCENDDFDMPDYIENFKLACLLQNTSEEMYPGLARPVLFDYRNYNQSLSKNCLLIEVGSHGNSLEEAAYTGELLGNIIAKVLTQY